MSEESIVVLRPSPRGGVGCFATTAIQSGGAVRLFDEHDWTFVAGSADDLPEPFWHYVVLTKGGYWRPPDFARMSVGWYLNHSASPNLRIEHDMYYAIHDIASDVELTIDYRTLDEDEDNTVGLALVEPIPQLKALLASMDEWIDNDEPLMVEDVFEWRDALAAALGKPARS